MATLDLFSEKSDLYAQARPQYPQALFDFLSLNVPHHDSAWDCATGSGQAAVDLANIFSHVQATDMSEQQIANAITNDRVQYSVQSAEQTTFANESFNLVTVAQALHWFDFEKFWPEVLRVLKPDGVFAAWGYDWFQISPAIDAAIDQYVMQVIKPYWAKQNQLVWNGYRDIDFPFEKITVPKIEMNQHWNLPQLLTYMHTWSATRQCMKVQGETFFEIAAQKIQEVWGEPLDIKEIKMNFHLYAGRKTS